MTQLDKTQWWIHAPLPYSGIVCHAESSSINDLWFIQPNEACSLTRFEKSSRRILVNVNPIQRAFKITWFIYY